MRNYNGWKRDKIDERDFKAHEHITFRGVLPTVFDLRKFCSAVEDQGSIGSCTGNAAVGALELLENKAKAKFVDLSRLFAYYNARLIEGTQDQDSGASIRDVVKGLATYGCCTEKILPYVVDNFAIKPKPSAYKEALKRKITLYAKVTQTELAIKTILASGYPIIFGAILYDSFESDETLATGIVKMPVAGEAELGGHALLLVGYDDSVKMAIAKNSWSDRADDKGYIHIPYEYILKYCMDFWVIKK